MKNAEKVPIVQKLTEKVAKTVICSDRVWSEFDLSHSFPPHHHKVHADQTKPDKFSPKQQHLRLWKTLIFTSITSFHVTRAC